MQQVKQQLTLRSYGGYENHYDNSWLSLPIMLMNDRTRVRIRQRRMNKYHSLYYIGFLLYFVVASFYTVSIKVDCYILIPLTKNTIVNTELVRFTTSGPTLRRSHYPQRNTYHDSISHLRSYFHNPSRKKQQSIILRYKRLHFQPLNQNSNSIYYPTQIRIQSSRDNDNDGFLLNDDDEATKMMDVQSRKESTIEHSDMQGVLLQVPSRDPSKGLHSSPILHFDPLHSVGMDTNLLSTPSQHLVHQQENNSGEHDFDQNSKRNHWQRDVNLHSIQPHHDHRTHIDKSHHQINQQQKGNDDMIRIENEYWKLKHDNEELHRTVHRLQDENRLLHYEIASKIVLENFEGEGKIKSSSSRGAGSTMQDGFDTSMDFDDASLWCDELSEDGQCPIEPTISFGVALRDRAYWLVGLLVLQSCSGIILAKNEVLLANHPFIIYFLTMLVGAGGNAGNQASVRVIRGLALGTLNEQTRNQFLIREFQMACSLSVILSVVGFIRAIVFRTPLPETITITVSLFIIVMSSVCLGAVLPLMLKKINIDPAHSSTSIQVLMDILGVVMSVVVSSVLLDSKLGRSFIEAVSGNWG